MITDVHNLSTHEEIDNKQEGKDENDKNEDISDNDLDNDDPVLERVGGSENEDENILKDKSLLIPFN